MKNRFTQLRYWLLLPVLLAAQLLVAQTTITGHITDQADGAAVIGATILEKGTTNGTASDLDGNFTLKISSADATLVITYTGYSAQEVAVAGRTSIDIKMGEDATVLDQVVVVGYGTQRKSDLTGSVGTVKTADIERIATASIDQALQGKIAGVYVSPASGEPGAGAIIRIRGTGTLNNSSPIYVIDGMITYDASFVNPQDVQSVEVLKDASACAIYGSRGSNGVILITTKNGKKREKAVVSLSSYYGTQQITRKIDMMNAAEFAQSYNELTNSPYYPDPASLGEGTDWQDEIFRKAPIGNLQISANGGTERSSYNISANYFKQDGVLKNGDFQRVTVRFNNEFAVNNWLTLGNNLAYSNSKRNIAPGGVVGTAYRMPPVFAPYDSAGKFTDPTSPFGLALANPAADLFYKSDNTRNGDRFFGTIYGDIKLFKYFTFRSNFGFDLDNNRGRTFSPKFQVSASQLNKDDRLYISTAQQRDWVWEQTLRFEREWGSHRLSALAGYTSEYRRYEGFGAGRSSFPGTSSEILYLNAGNDTTQINGGSQHDEALVSYLFRTNYVFSERYLLTVSARVDQASRFSRANRTAVFPSFSLGWNLGQESFIENLRIFDRLKLRGSYGILGNQNSIRDRYYPSFGLIVAGQYAVFGAGESLNQGATLVSLGNPDLRWETTRQTDIGLEIGLLNNRLSAEIDWYKRVTYDIVGAIPIPDYIGSQDDPIVNSAEVQNTGVDLTLNWRQAGRVSWNLGAIASPVRNKVIKFNDQKAEILASFIQGEPATRSIPGEPIGSFYGFKSNGVFQSAEEAMTSPRLGNETAGDLRYVDINGDGKIDGLDRINLGSPIPTLTYGFTAGVDFAGFDLAADLFGVSGNKVYNSKKTFRFAVYNWEQSVFDGRWTPENTTATKPRITNGGHNYRVSDYYLEDGSFVRLRSLVLGYSLPTRWLQRAAISKFRVYASGFNLWTSQKYSGYSPEFGNDSSSYEVGFDNGGYPITKSWQFGLEVTF